MTITCFGTCHCTHCTCSGSKLNGVDENFFYKTSRKKYSTNSRKMIFQIARVFPKGRFSDSFEKYELLLPGLLSQSWCSPYVIVKNTHTYSYVNHKRSYVPFLLPSQLYNLGKYIKSKYVLLQFNCVELRSIWKRGLRNAGIESYSNVTRIYCPSTRTLIPTRAQINSLPIREEIQQAPLCWSRHSSPRMIPSIYQGITCLENTYSYNNI